jgi:hypothetical protein
MVAFKWMMGALVAGCAVADMVEEKTHLQETCSGMTPRQLKAEIADLLKTSFPVTRVMSVFFCTQVWEGPLTSLREGTRRFLARRFSSTSTTSSTAPSSGSRYGLSDASHVYTRFSPLRDRQDFTFKGTQMLKDIHEGEDDSYPSLLTPFKGKIFFAAEDEEHGKELFVSDGTADGTRKQSSTKTPAACLKRDPKIASRAQSRDGLQFTQPEARRLFCCMPFALT